MTRKILIVDDSALIRNLVWETLNALPAVTTFREAVDVPSAVKALSQWQPDFVTLDLQMPGGSGLDVLQAIKASGLSPIVIVLTSLLDPQTRAACLAAGAHFILDKVSDMDQLHGIVSNQIPPHCSPSTRIASAMSVMLRASNLC